MNIPIFHSCNSYIRLWEKKADNFKSILINTFWVGSLSKKFPNEIQKTARRKMIHIGSAKTLEDLKIPPGNKASSACL